MDALTIVLSATVAVLLVLLWLVDGLMKKYQSLSQDCLDLCKDRDITISILRKQVDDLCAERDSRLSEDIAPQDVIDNCVRDLANRGFGLVADGTVHGNGVW